MEIEVPLAVLLSAQRHMNPEEKARKMAFPLRPLAEQTRILAEVERRLSILQKAFTGELV